MAPGTTATDFVFCNTVQYCSKLFIFQIVPDDFFNKPNSKCPKDSNRLGCYCMETDTTRVQENRARKHCKSIVKFLTLCGRFSVKANVDIIYREAELKLGQSAEKFEDLVNKIVYPIFRNRFFQKIHNFTKP